MKILNRNWMLLGFGAVGIGAIGFFAWARSRRDLAKKAQEENGGVKLGQDSRDIDMTRKYGDDRTKRDLVEEASWESFPASDPPAY